MVDGRRTGAAAVLLGLALATSACGDPADHPASQRSTAPSSPSASASASPSSSTPSVSPLSAAHPGRLVVVPADRFGTTCPRSRPAGVVCDSARHAYRFQPEAVRTVLVARADAEQAANGQWVVDVGTTAAGRRTLAGVTRSAARTREFVLLMPRRTGPAITAAQVQQAITGGTVQISGTGTREDAQRIVNQITRTAR